MKFQKYPRKAKKMKSLGGFFQSFLPPGFSKKTFSKSTTAKKTNEFEFVDLHLNWKKIVGEKLSEFTRPQKIMRHTLIIMTKHSQYAHHLIHMEHEVKERIFACYPTLRGKIQKLRFEQNEAFFIEKKFEIENMTQDRQYLENSQKYHPLSPTFKKLNAEAQCEFADVKDNDVKSSLVKLFIQKNSD
jgi:hypothetical protein